MKEKFDRYRAALEALQLAMADGRGSYMEMTAEQARFGNAHFSRDPETGALLIDRSEVVTTANYARMFSEARGADGKTAMAMVQTAVEDGVSRVEISADQIHLEGSTTINGNFSIDTDGFVRAQGGTFTGQVKTGYGLMCYGNHDRYSHFDGSMRWLDLDRLPSMFVIFDGLSPMGTENIPDVVRGYLTGDGSPYYTSVGTSLYLDLPSFEIPVGADATIDTEMWTRLSRARTYVGARIFLTNATRNTRIYIKGVLTGYSLQSQEGYSIIPTGDYNSVIPCYCLECKWGKVSNGTEKVYWEVSLLNPPYAYLPGPTYKDSKGNDVDKTWNFPLYASTPPARYFRLPDTTPWAFHILDYPGIENGMGTDSAVYLPGASHYELCQSITEIISVHSSIMRQFRERGWTVGGAVAYQRVYADAYYQVSMKAWSERRGLSVARGGAYYVAQISSVNFEGTVHQVRWDSASGSLYTDSELSAWDSSDMHGLGFAPYRCTVGGPRVDRKLWSGQTGTTPLYEGDVFAMYVRIHAELAYWMRQYDWGGQTLMQYPHERLLVRPSEIGAGVLDAPLYALWCVLKRYQRIKYIVSRLFATQ